MQAARVCMPIAKRAKPIGRKERKKNKKKPGTAQRARKTLEAET